jgi:ADP-L-glycero-D-manno-heptose 6-epimerase
MIIVTGGAGFIGSNVVKKLNELGHKEIVIVDNLDEENKWKNVVGLSYFDFIHKDELLHKLYAISENGNPSSIQAIIHLGACTSTVNNNCNYLLRNNYEYTRELYNWCVNNEVRFIYASSAAVYGDGELGYSDNETEKYNPLNMYGYTKKQFDMYVGNLVDPIQTVGLRFFNVYGPNEAHKGQMASMIYHMFKQIKETGRVKLFKSYRKEYADGEQKRDFVYVKDVVDSIIFFFENPGVSGIYNVGTGEARSFNDVALIIFKTLGLEPNIEYVDMPENIKRHYQYYTQADLSKMKTFNKDFSPAKIEVGVAEYVEWLKTQYK